MKKLRRINEAEVIAEFLKAEFYHPEYDGHRRKFQALVQDPNLTDSTENAVRRVLLYKKRATMWRELPEDIQWWEIELDFSDLERVNVFPRAQWRTISDGDFQALHVAERIRNQERRERVHELFEKIEMLRSRLQFEGPKSTVVLIGLDEHQSLTLLEGNHRFISALLLPREIMLRRLRLICGFSPNMEKCCWYKTNFRTLLHYCKNRIKHLLVKEPDVNRLLPQTGKTGARSYAGKI
ncbi:MAG TPA: hypothetical protein VKZ53_07150 [Candidatus Angelobacter sp.]|nr:hypothetical protein [Candidatus Angelobacter sp.]